MQKLSFTLFTLFSVILIFQSCKKDDITNVDEDQVFFEEYQKATLTAFRDSGLLSGVSPSPHGSFKLYFNGTAQAALGTDGNLPMGETFPEGSMIVKEIYSNGSPSLIALMKKEAGNAQVASGWVWGEYGPSGNTVYSAGKKGIGCTGCHGGGTNRDLVRTFDLH